MGKIKDGIEDMRSCYSCYHNREAMKAISRKEKLYCLKYKKIRKFRKYCIHYLSMSCNNCNKLIDMKKIGKIITIGIMRYDYYQTWLVKCREYDELKLKTRTDSTKQVAEYPSCSLWIRREETLTDEDDPEYKVKW